MPDPAPSARAIALDLTGAVLRHRRPLDEALEAHHRLPDLAPRDRAFTRLLVTTVVRRLGQVDALVAACLDRPLPGGAKDIHDILRLGAAQLAFLGTPPHAAVDTAVQLATGRHQGRYGKLVNAVLRRIGRDGAAAVADQDAARLNTPDWLWTAWCDAYGAATARAVAEAHLGEPPLDLSVKSEAEQWAGRLGATALPTGSLRLWPRGPVNELPGFADGAWWVQDAAAALPARLLGAVDGLDVVDLCAAPGGKTAQLAAAGARVTAVDRSANRLKRLTDNLRRLHLGAAVTAADATVWRPDRPADAVLLDAPCSATGTLRRHPDVARLKGPEDVAKLAALQARLLRAAVEMVRPGGLIVYCSCSLQPAEGPDQIAALLADGAPVERTPIEVAEIGGLADLLTADGDLRTLPCHLAADGGLDGFYAARLRRR